MPGPSLKSSLTQAFPPKPKFTENDVPDLQGKVYIVTGANTGVGKDLTHLLYTRNAKVYMLARSEDKTKTAITEIQKSVPKSKGSLHFIKLDLADLSTIKGTVQQFLSQETKLHVLFNNAGVLNGAKEVTFSAQGYEQHVGVNVLGTFLLTELLTPILVASAKTEPSSTVRVVWASSSAAEIFAEEKIGIKPEALSVKNLEATSGLHRYWASKVANWAHGAEYARRHRADGVVSVPLNPGNLQSDLYRDQGFFFRIFIKLMMYAPINGAYTELFAGLSPEVNIGNTGCWVVPFGRVYPIREDMVFATKTEAEGGTGGNLKLWEWTEAQVAPYR